MQKMEGRQQIEHAVVLHAPLGHVRYRDLNGSYRIRVEAVSRSLPLLRRSSGWKQPGNDGEERCSIVLPREQLFDVLVFTIRALGQGAHGVEVHPSGSYSGNARQLNC
jgi:hypothetical protein